jgi:hypothetical protein
MRHYLLPIVVVAALAACSQMSPPSGSLTGKNRPAYVGDQLCRDCHFSEYKQWSDTRHARAFQVLPGERRDDPECLVCHTTGFTLRGEASRKLINIQCEACHGPGELYVKSMTRERTHSGYSRQLNLSLGLEVPSAHTCQPCHGGPCPVAQQGPFDYATARARIDHTGFLEERYPAKFEGR